jgi:hypothetical protein
VSSTLVASAARTVTNDDITGMSTTCIASISKTITAITLQLV